MGARLLRWFSPPRFEDEEKTRVAEIVNVVLLAALLGVVFFAVFTAFVRLNQTRMVILMLALVIAAIVIGLKALLHRGRVRLVATVFTAAVWTAFTIPIVLFEGIRDTGVAGYYLAVLITSLVLSTRTLVLFDALASLSIVLIYLLEREGVLVTMLSEIPPSPVDLAAVLFTLNGTALLAAFTVRKLATGERVSRRERDRAQRYLGITTTVLDGIEADVYVADMASYEVLFANRHIRGSFGENLVGQCCYEVFRGESAVCPHCTNPQLLDADGSPAGTVAWESYNPVTQRWYINQDRAVRWVDGRLARLQVATDITERKRSEEARAHTQRLLLALSQAAQAVQRARSPEAVYHAIGEQVAALGMDVFVLTVDEQCTALSPVYATTQARIRAGGEGLSAPGSIPLTPHTPLHRAVAQAEMLFSTATEEGSAGAAVETPSAEGETPVVDPLLVLTGQQRRIIAPLAVGGEVQALLVIAGSTLAESDVSAVTVFANQAAIAIENARLYRETEELSAFNERLIVSMAEGIIVLGKAGRVTFANPAAAEMLGYAADGLLGLHWTDYTPSDQRTIVEAADERRVRGLSDRYDVELVGKDGRRLSVLVSGSPLFDDDGRFIGTTAVFTDITAAARAQRALRESEQFLANVFDAIQDGISVLDSDLTVVRTNAWMERMYADQMPIVGKACHQAYYERAEHCSWCPALQTLATGEPSMEVVPYQPAGEPAGWLELSTFPIRDEAGRVTNIIEYVKDISERRRAEEERGELAARVREQAQQMAQILATVPAGVLLMTAEGHIVQANPVAEEQLATLAGKAGEGPLQRIGDRAVTDLLTSPEPGGLWHEVKGSGRILEVLARPVEAGASQEHWVLVLNDVTLERQVRQELQQQERLAAVGQLAAGIAHDFNNILATIVLYTEMVAKAAELSDRSRERLAVVDQQAWDATRLIQQILDFSRRSVLERRRLDLVPLVTEQVKLLERTLPDHIQVVLVHGDDDYRLDADPTRMRQMLVNLALNARDAMAEGGTLRIELARLQKASRWRSESDVIRLTVSDTGVGIAPEALPHIFEPFFTTKGPGGGSGLGLAQVHGIAGQHGGKVEVRSELGVGTVFTVDLPAYSTAPVPASALPVDAALSQGAGETILVVEDNPALRAALDDALRQLGYQVLAAGHGREALEILTQHPEVVLVLTDLVMPEMGGQALFRAMREQGVDVPVVMLTGHPMEQELELLRDEGLVGWMMKPPDMAQLASLLAQVIQGSAGE